MFDDSVFAREMRVAIAGLEPGAVHALRRGLGRSPRHSVSTADSHPPSSSWCGSSSSSSSLRVFRSPQMSFPWPTGPAPCSIFSTRRIVEVPGWPLRNFLMLLVSRWGLTARPSCYRGAVLAALGNESGEVGGQARRGGEEDAASGVIFAPGREQTPSDGGGSAGSAGSGRRPEEQQQQQRRRRRRACRRRPPEANRNGKWGRKMDLSSLMDAANSGRASADLTRPMRWRRSRARYESPAGLLPCCSAQAPLDAASPARCSLGCGHMTCGQRQGVHESGARHESPTARMGQT